MIVPGKPKPMPAPAAAPKPAEPDRDEGLTAQQLVKLAQHMRPVVTVQAAKRLSEWVFTVHRDPQGRIVTIDATGKPS